MRIPKSTASMTRPCAKLTNRVYFGNQLRQSEVSAAVTARRAAIGSYGEETLRTRACVQEASNDQVSSGIARINASSVLAGQSCRHQGVDASIWLATFVHSDLSCFHLQQKILRLLDTPFGTRLSP